MHRSTQSIIMVIAMSFLAGAFLTTQAFGVEYFGSDGKSHHSSMKSAPSTTSSKKNANVGSGSPAEGYTIHIQAPHLMPDGTPGGPYHHYCKGISDKILQCLLFETTAPNAPLVAIEYFVAKELSRTLPLIQWHRYFHDHKQEIATGRVKILDIDDPTKIKALAEAASKTDGVIYHLWQKGKEFPDGTVTFPQSLGHIFNQPE
ncbi:MAG: DUF1264 domain-containing protein [Nitrospirales bacterium]|nr:DUF1264 domain-containing protein [Nitrospirales bacterium]